MIDENKFEILNLKGKLGKIRDWMKNHHFPPQLLFFLIGIISTIWFLIRVIPKPSRAAYPCMRVAAPFMAGFILYLLAVGGITVASRKAKRKIFNVKYLATGLLAFGVIVTIAITPAQNTTTSYQDKPTKSGPDDGPNQPMGQGMGVNQGTAKWILKQDDRNNGYYYPLSLTAGEAAKNGNSGTCETNPNIVLEILRELVNLVGIDQKNIAIGDPISHILGHNYEAWATEFPDVVYVDKSSTSHGRTLINPTSNDLVFYSDKTQSNKLYDIIEKADYMINVANLKPHGRAGITLTAKNHFGSQARSSVFHLHYSLVSPVTSGKPTNDGYHKYRVLGDLMGSRYLGQNTLLYIVDGLYGGGSNETKRPVKYYMAPFNNDWSSSIFLSQDQVALESVCYDFLRTEWNGINKHHPSNNAYETIPNVNGVDDYLHQAADYSNWPKGISYDPDNSGKPLSSLGIHEHWNNPERKQYSRNLGHSYGIDLISIPDTLVKTGGSVISSNTSIQKETQGTSQSSVINITTLEIRTISSSAEKTGRVNSGWAQKAEYLFFMAPCGPLSLLIMD